MSFRKRSWQILRWIVALFILIFAAILLAAFIPLHPDIRMPESSVAGDFARAKAAIEGRIEMLPPSLSDAGRPRVFLHDRPTDQVFVLLHGLTNSPEQFDKLGRILFERGHNVVIPVMPGHGKADLMTDYLRKFTAEAMMDSANEAVTISRSLGRRVTVVGLSVNGTSAAWMAQKRRDVDCVVMLAPFFSPHGLPENAAAPLARLLVRLPNFFLWWDPVHQQDLPGPAHAYPRFSSRSIGAAMLVGTEVIEASLRFPPESQSILIVTTAADDAASNALTDRVVSNWRARRPQAVSTFEFPKGDQIPHDFIDPKQPGQRVDFVYPRLIEMIEFGGSE